MMLIPLGNKSGEAIYAKVDDEDFASLSEHKWHRSSAGYAVRLISFYYSDIPAKRGEGPRKRGARAVWMHRFIAKTPEDMVTDHINGNGLDNRRSNLRICTPLQNTMNRRPRDPNRSIGVRFERGQWVARMSFSGRRWRIGYFGTQAEAVVARRNAELELFGAFAPGAPA